MVPGRHDAAPSPQQTRAPSIAVYQVTEPFLEPLQLPVHALPPSPRFISGSRPSRRRPVRQLRFTPDLPVARFTPSAVAQVRQLPVHALPPSREGRARRPVRSCVPRPVTSTPAAPIQEHRAPSPPSSRARPPWYRDRLASGRRASASCSPATGASVQVAFVHRPASRLCDCLWIVEHGSPQVRDISVKVVHGAPARELLGAIEPHGAGAKERFDVVSAIHAEAGPDKIGSF